MLVSYGLLRRYQCIESIARRCVTMMFGDMAFATAPPIKFAQTVRLDCGGLFEDLLKKTSVFVFISSFSNKRIPSMSFSCSLQVWML